MIDEQTIANLRESLREATPRPWAQDDCRSYLETLRACEESGVWPGYSQTTLPIDVPEEEVEIDFGDAEAA